MAFYNFRKDLNIAKKTEIEVAEYLEKIYNAEIIEFEDSNKYDILTFIRGKNVTFEVKEDFMCEQTGNVGLEFECRGKPSGISVTLADYHIHKVHTKDDGIRYVLHKTEALKKMISNHEYFRVVNGGDKGSNSMNYLFKYPIFIRTGKILPLTE